jgi:hypothetical protein
MDVDGAGAVGRHGLVGATLTVAVGYLDPEQDLAGLDPVL